MLLENVVHNIINWSKLIVNVLRICKKNKDLFKRNYLTVLNDLLCMYWYISPVTIINLPASEVFDGIINHNSF